MDYSPFTAKLTMFLCSFIGMPTDFDCGFKFIDEKVWLKTPSIKNYRLQ